MRFFLGGVPFGCDNIGDEAISASVVGHLTDGARFREKQKEVYADFARRPARAERVLVSTLK